MRLLEQDGWSSGRRTTHGVSFTKRDKDGHTLVTIIPDKTESLDQGTLSAILGFKQTGLTRKGLERLIKQYGIK